MSLPQDLRLAARLARDLPRFLRHPVSVPEARTVVARRRARREDDFLKVVRQGIFEHPPSPYRPLLRRAGCELGDLDRLVRRDGVEGALAALFRSGVYLTAAEFKGRAPVVRGGETLAASLDGLRNPLSTTHLRGATSGSRGHPFTVPVDLANIRDWAVNFCLLFEMLGPRRWRHARWSLPAGDGLAFGLLYAGFGSPLARWFTPVDPAAPGVHARYQWACRLLAWESRAVGVPLPYPEHVPVDSPEPILRWLTDTLRVGDTPHLVAYVSPAVRLCEAAERTGRDLRGAHIRLVGEPVTAGRLAAIRRAGPEVSPDYGAVDVGLIGSACRAPAAPDEVHLWDDLIAVIQAAGAPSRRRSPTRHHPLLVPACHGSARPAQRFPGRSGDRAGEAVRLPPGAAGVVSATPLDPKLREAHHGGNDRARRGCGADPRGPCCPHASAAEPRTTSSSKTRSLPTDRAFACSSIPGSARWTRLR